MRIAVICPNYPPSRSEGGVSHYTQLLASRLAGLGEDILVITNGEYTGTGKDEALEVLKVSGEWKAETAWEIAGLLRSRGADGVNLQYTPSLYTNGFKSAWPKASARLPAVTSFHTLWGGGTLNHWFAFRLLSASRAVVATNSEITYLLGRYLPFFSKKTRQIPIGANILPLSEPGGAEGLKEGLGLRPEAAIVSYFGMCYPGKGMSILLETARWLKQRLDFHLLLIGGGMSDVDEHRRRAREQAQRLGLEEHVLWTGRLAAGDVSRLLTLSEVVFLPYEGGVSDRRGTLMAALAHGKAIVTSAPRIPRFPFQREEHMMWPERYEPVAFAELLLRVLKDPALRGRLETGARQLARRYDWDVIARQTRELFHEVAQSL